MAWVWGNFDQIWALTLSHVVLSVIPVVVGVILSVPLGWLASHYQLTRSILLLVSGVLYTIPSLALFIILPGVLGTGILDPTNVVVALSIYAVALMVRSAADAFASVPAEVQDSATAVGFSPLQRFLAVDLPLAGPVLLAGIRVVSVSTVSIVTVGSVIGVSTLGNLFLDGFQRFFLAEIITGIVTVLLLAIVFDAVLVLLGRLTMPWNRRLTPSRTRRLAASQPQAVPR
ncbi:ABC transporter permease [Cryobacterium sp. CG_9.6]|uniref:ABC transporter permease n=1 Tax=Cryobacterium sp. CG_9.6 TaxID=2760710 RepID=UPI0024765EFC|nr:ABC transporter permease [Cryobacterium sp. CG_9.6]MDH6238447.1 osmoprotectant transport system permease protein [Cryobacterium sp. CG_9.6]